jgi:tetratricopeptide (TPR) repeat protein
MKVAEFAAEKGNESPKLMARIGSLMIEDDKFDEAEPFLRRAVDEGKVPSAFGDLANVLWDRAEGDGDQGKEDRAEAMKLLETAVEQSAIAKATLDMLLDLHEDEGDEKATTLLLAAADKHSGSATVLRYVATMYLDGDDPSKAAPFLQQILALPRRSLDDDAFARRVDSPSTSTISRTGTMRRSSRFAPATRPRPKRRRSSCARSSARTRSSGSPT